MKICEEAMYARESSMDDGNVHDDLFENCTRQCVPCLVTMPERALSDDDLANGNANDTVVRSAVKLERDDYDLTYTIRAAKRVMTT